MNAADHIHISYCLREAQWREESAASMRNNSFYLQILQYEAEAKVFREIAAKLKGGE